MATRSKAKENIKPISGEAEAYLGDMADIENKKVSLANMLRKLSYFNKSTGEILKQNYRETLSRQYTLLNAKINEVFEAISGIQELYIDSDADEETIDAWSSEIKAQLTPFETSTKEIKSAIELLDRKMKEKQRNEQFEYEAYLRSEARKEEMEAEELKLARKYQHELELEERKLEIAERKRVHAKLPDLQITKFQGNHLDWLRFWSIFKSQIDETELPEEAKFAYLKELLVSKVRSMVDKLPSDSRGYEKAKNMLLQRYGDTLEVVNAHVQQIMALPTIHSTSRVKIHEFYDNLLVHVEALDTLGKLEQVRGNVRMTLDKLDGIRADLTRTDEKWKEWDFNDLLEALRLWTERNPMLPSEKEGRHVQKEFKREKTFAAREQKSKQCVYCEIAGHKSSECQQVINTEERRRILSDRKLCFNCTGAQHRASECKSKSSCLICKRKHHTSICDRVKQSNSHSQGQILTATNEKKVVHPVVIINIEGIKCRALLDTGSSSSYVSSTVVNMIKKKPLRQEIKTIEMMLQRMEKKVDIYEVELKNLEGTFSLHSEVNGIERKVLLTLPNPHYERIIAKNKHLDGIDMNDNDGKEYIPVHVILGASDYALIKTSTPTRIGNLGQPIAEKTKFGWIIMSPGQDEEDTTLMYTRTTHEDYMEMCSLDVLGIEDRSEGNQSYVYDEFKEQLYQRDDGRYEVSLPWKPGHPELPSNRNVAEARFNSLMRKLDKQPGMLETYDEIIRNQIKEGIVELAPAEIKGPVHYIPHKPVVRENAQSTKVRIVYDASAKEDKESPSLNDCLEIGPPLQRKILDILTIIRFKPILLTGDIKQAFLQIFIRESERDVLRFIWVDDLESRVKTIYRVTRVLFGLGSSPFLLNGTLQQHFERYKYSHENCIKELSDGIYVDDIHIGGNNVAEVKEMKETAIKIFADGGFELHKWHCNSWKLDGEADMDCDSTFAKEKLNVRYYETKLLGVKWDKDKDELSVVLPKLETPVTKRSVLSTIAKIYDPLGLVSPATLTAKVIFRDICDRKLSWDAQLPTDLLKQWLKWMKTLPNQVSISRSISTEGTEITLIELHGFADASILGCCAVVYAVVRHGNLTSQSILVSKSRLSRKNLTIPRLELVSCHMVTNLLDNIANTLEQYTITKQAWTDSTVCLYWLKGIEQYKQFVSNRIRKIKEKKIEFRYVPSGENPADIGSRGTNNLQENGKWLQGPSWLKSQGEWPKNIVIMPTEETETEKRMIKEIMRITVQKDKDLIDVLLKKKRFWKAIKILAWCRRFINNCTKISKSDKLKGPLTRDEVEEQEIILIKKAQKDVLDSESFITDSKRLNLRENAYGIFVCHGRIEGDYPIYLPYGHLVTESIVEYYHRQTLHGGVGLTMAKVREKFWVPKLRSLTKRVRKDCYGCKRFQVSVISAPPQGNLPRVRSEGTIPFQVIGLDFAGPIMYRGKGSTEYKGYIILYTCSLTRGLHLEFLRSMSCEEFLISLKRFIAARGRPEVIYSDNAKTFIASSQWIKKLRKEEKLHDYLSQHEVKWRFNLSRASWWGGWFERMISLVKQALYKVIGRAKLTFIEMQGVLLDIQIALNNRPLSYCEDDIELPTLTPNILIFGKANYLFQEQPNEIMDKDLRKRAKYILRCKERLWIRWQTEYLRALRERHDCEYKGKENHLQIGDVVMVKGDEKNRGKWTLGVINSLIVDKNKVVRGAKLRTGKFDIERPIQFLYPLELSCSEFRENGSTAKKLNVDAKEFRPKRRAATDARANIRGIFGFEENEIC